MSQVSNVQTQDVQATFCATLVDEWVRAGVAHAMIAPGSRSTPLALALDNRDEIQTHIFLDERSAGFAALGVGMATGVAAVALCTSGTAAVHVHAAVVEADLSCVPLLVVTADRPSELHHVGAPQTIEQDHLYGRSTRWACNPGVADIATSATWRSIASRAVLETVSGKPGPVHLNVPFREPLVGVAQPLPEARLHGAAWHRRVLPNRQRVTLSGATPRGVIVAGNTAGTIPAYQILALGESLGWPVLADARSGCRTDHPNAISSADAMLRSEEFLASIDPEVIVRVGQPSPSKVVSQWLSSVKASIWSVDATDSWYDAERVADSVFESLPWPMPEAKPSPSSWLSKWRRADKAAQTVFAKWAEADVLSEITTARLVVDSLGPHTNLVVSSSMPIRDVEFFGAPCVDVNFYANRGANGIDGVLATAIGVAVGSDLPTVLYIGDVALLHDSSSLARIRHHDIDLRIVLSDNDGGSIFSFLQQGSDLDSWQFERLFGTPHATDFAALAGAHHLDYQHVHTGAQLSEQLQLRGPRLIHVTTDRGVNVAQHAEIQVAASAAVSATLKRAVSVVKPPKAAR